jgi:hypothetical protein
MWNKRSAPQLLPTGYVAPISRKKLPKDPHERPVVTEDNKAAVRGGSTGNNVRYILIVLPSSLSRFSSSEGMSGLLHRL